MSLSPLCAGSDPARDSRVNLRTLPLLFSYGTLQDPRAQRELFGRPLIGTPDELVGFRCGDFHVTDAAFAKRSGGAVHVIVRFTGRDSDRTHGTALEVTDAELEAADAYEPVGYRRVPTTLASGREAWVYTEDVSSR